ncbi:MMPL family transporter [Kribbella sp. NPDC055110]
MERFTAGVMRHRVVVVLVWVAVTVVGVLIAPHLSSRLQSGTTLHTASYTANATLQREYGGVAANPSVLVIDLPAGSTADSPATRQALSAANQVATQVRGVHSLSYASTGDKALVGDGGRSTVMLIYPPAAGDPVAQPLMDAMSQTITRALPGARVAQTGIEQLSAGGSAGGASVVNEILIGGALALLVLLWVFGSALAILPLISAAVSVLTMQSAIYGLTYLTSIHINPAVQFIVALLGLGLSVDYSLLLVNRWREERLSGASNRAAVAAALTKAGHSVAFSGIVASLGLFALIVVPISFIRGIGLSGLFIPSIAAVVALTVVPLLLWAVGERLDRVRLPRRRTNRADATWARIGRTIVAHPRKAAALGGSLLAALAIIGLTINIAGPPSTSLAAGGPAESGLLNLQHNGFPTGVLTSVPIYLPVGTDPGTVAATLRTLPDIHGVLVDPAWHTAGSSVIMALPQTEIGTTTAGPALAGIRAAVPGSAQVGGAGVQTADMSHIITTWFPVLLAVVALITFVLLARGMRSLLLPAKAVALNILSVGAAYGALVLIWQHGFGSHSIWGIAATGSVHPFVPMMLFGFLFGISMDYEVFILARMRESYDREHDTGRAVVEGISRTGRLVTSAALILVLALLSLSSAPDLTVKMMATGMAAGVLIDAVIVRTLLTPALVVLFGRANWYLPGWAARLLRIKIEEPRHATPEEQPEPVGSRSSWQA